MFWTEYPRMVRACPACDRANIYKRLTAPEDEAYRCGECGHVFPEPVVRGSK